MKNQFIILLLLINLAACDVFRPASRSTDNLTDESGTNPQQKNQIRFLFKIYLRISLLFPPELQ